MDNEKLATLVSMGFDIDLCEAILQVQNLTIEEAIQRLLDAQQKTVECQGESQNIGNAVLGTEDSASVCSKKEINPSTEEATKDETEHITSRLALSERQKEIKEEYERKWREEVQVAVKKRKMQAKNAKGFILQEIEANKKRLKDLRDAKNAAVVDCPEKQEEDHSITSNSGGGNADVCRIQIRLPSSLVITNTFPDNSPLSDVAVFALQHIEGDQVTKEPILVQPFPRREFTSEDMESSLLSLGLHPNASLVLMLKKHTNQSGSSNLIQKESMIHSTCHSYDGDRTSNVHSVHNTPQIQQHSWGGGMRLSDNFESNHQGDGAVDSELQNRRDNIRQSALLHSVLETAEKTVVSGNQIEIDREGTTASASTTNASTAIASSTSASSSNCKVEQRQRNTAVIEAIEKRSVPAVSSKAIRRKEETPQLARDIHPLVELCADCVAKNLAAQNGSILSFIGRTLSQHTASQVIRELKNRKLLTGKLLQLFHPCKLTTLDLDGYSLTSNEILEAARLHSTLTRLRLSQCALITDTGVIAAVRGLKHLQIVDLSGCVQVTDKSLSEIKDLHELRSLRLDNTKIGDEGIRDFLFNQIRTSLEELSLNSTNTTHKAFSISDNDIKFNVSVLFLDRTKVSSLDFLQRFPHIRRISLSGAPLTQQSMQSLGELRQLEELNLNHTKLSDDALKYVVGLPLRTFALPDRLAITDAGLRYIEGLPLTSLDLADYIQITDIGVASVGKISSLTSLSLANTKITDGGLQHIRGLNGLQELDLGRTAVTNASVKAFKGLRSLHTLSLASTRITNEIFVDGTMNAFENLVKLNVSRNRISDFGLRHLHLMFLEVINADQTYTSPSAILELTGCPNLKAVRARNCKAMTELEEEQ